MKDLVLKPRMSEKTYGLSESRVYVFDVPKHTNKHAVERAIAAQFEVEVLRVNIASIAGKAKRTISKGGRRVAKGRDSDTRKAYVTLKEGQSIPIFAAVEEAEEKEQKLQEQVDKAATKQAKKDEKQTAKPARRGIHLPGRRSGARGGNK